MTKFCETCPLRADASDEIDSLIYDENVVGTLGGITFELGAMGVLVDANRNISEVFRCPSKMSEKIQESIFERIDNCQQPYTKEKGIFSKRTVVTGCRALGNLALSSNSSLEMSAARSLRSGYYVANPPIEPIG